MQGPFHAIGILRPWLDSAAFAQAANWHSGLDVVRGLTYSDDLGHFVNFVPGTVMTIFSGSAIVLSAWAWLSNHEATQPNRLVDAG